MTPPTTAQTETMHKLYVAMTGLDIPYTMQRHYSWESWLVAGHTQPDLELVVHYIKRRIKEGRREKESLLFRNMIQNKENFAEDLAIAKAESRNSPRMAPDKIRVLRATGRAENPPQAKPEPVRGHVEKLIRELHEAVEKRDIP